MGAVIQIQLTQGQIAIIDAEDEALVRRFKWCATLRRGKFYAQSFLWLKGMNRQKTIHMGRLILNVAPGKLVDHKDGNPLDNRRSNLREATYVQNACNRRKSPLNTSGFTGVSWNERENKWQAYVKVNRKRKHLGWFASLPDAVEARKQASLKFYGDFNPVERTF